jgi:phytol kinase
VAIETCVKKLHFNPDVTRKIAHTIAGFITIFTPYYLTKWEIFFIGIIFSIILTFTKIFKLIPSIHSVQRKTLGEIFFPLGIALSAIIFLPSNTVAFQCGILVLAVSDALAAIIGIKFGKHVFNIFGNKKSLEGSIAFFITTGLILLGFDVDFVHILIVSLLLTIVEFFLVFGLDNLILPILSAYILTIINLYL